MRFTFLSCNVTQPVGRAEEEHSSTTPSAPSSSSRTSQPSLFEELHSISLDNIGGSGASEQIFFGFKKFSFNYLHSIMTVVNAMIGSKPPNASKSIMNSSSRLEDSPEDSTSGESMS